jgi:hypothetical protein
MLQLATLFKVGWLYEVLSSNPEVLSSNPEVRNFTTCAAAKCQGLWSLRASFSNSVLNVRKEAMCCVEV